MSTEPQEMAVENVGVARVKPGDTLLAEEHMLACASCPRSDVVVDLEADRRNPPTAIGSVG
ncbi:hypothetical protein [Amycolatopsis orientalis]|uniref:hypothetical protein n=1 Tax=Amycolatopsis orientalis TaxID=31958 RepID=UPI0003A31ACC|nr:hypothetical protein [Amycolatopsis orientalis]